MSWKGDLPEMQEPNGDAKFHPKLYGLFREKLCLGSLQGPFSPDTIAVVEIMNYHSPSVTVTKIFRR